MKLQTCAQAAKSFREICVEHAQAQSAYRSAANVLMTAAKHVLRDKDSKLNEVSKRLLQDAVSKFESLEYGEKS